MRVISSYSSLFHFYENKVNIFTDKTQLKFFLFLEEFGSDVRLLVLQVNCDSTRLIKMNVKVVIVILLSIECAWRIGCRRVDARSKRQTLYSPPIVYPNGGTFKVCFCYTNLSFFRSNDESQNIPSNKRMKNLFQLTFYYLSGLLKECSQD